MHDARDAEDTRLLEDGEYAALVESYYGVMLDRSRVKVRREDDAIAVAAEVAIASSPSSSAAAATACPFGWSSTKCRSNTPPALAS